jgi:arginine-tRNA-protein transferase
VTGPGAEDGTLLLYHSQDHACPYLPGRTARNLFVDPQAPKDPLLYGQLIDRGFRRSGEHIYRPHCPQCRACISSRLPVTRFQPRRNQRRIWNLNNQKIRVVSQPVELQQAHFELYSRYISQRHPRGEMATSSAEDFFRFLVADWCDSCFFEFHLDDRLVAVAIMDILPQGLSAVYTFYDPALPRLSLGAYAILWQIQHTRRLGLPFLYLGYWVPDCRKMEYKQAYRPLQLYSREHWQEFPPQAEIILPEMTAPVGQK